MKEKNIAIVLAAGQGRRMGGGEKKQYLLIEEKPVLYYSLRAFEDAPLIHQVVLVTGEGEEAYVRENIVDRYSFHKVTSITEGGKERCHSVYNGLKAIQTCDYVLIQDGARPFLTQQVIEKALECARQTKACVVGMPVKDTIKIADERGFISETPNRNRLWAVQTPQVFAHALVKHAYELLMEKESELQNLGITVTDDAMVVETFTNTLVKLVEGGYQNIKITTPEDLEIARTFVRLRQSEKLVEKVGKTC